MGWFDWTLVGVGALLVIVALRDLTQRRHAILRNFPLLGHFRYWFESIGPELRQYIVADNDEERPFSRDQRRWVYASSKNQNTYFGFGTDNDLEASSPYLIIRHAAFPLPNPAANEPGYDPEARLPAARVLGAARGRKKAFRPHSIVNTSAMSFGSLSGAATEAMNRGAALAGCLQNTGEGAISVHHQHGGELIWQIGTGYFGCRAADGTLDFDQLVERALANPVRAIEIKLSQGAKPGVGGFLPAAKVTPEIAATRGIPVGEDCASPASHSAFSSADELLDFVERVADATGLPVGIKSAVGERAFWNELAELMATTDRGVDFISIDGGEGGTGAAPLVFADHVALPFKIGFSRVYRTFREAGVHDKVHFIGSARLGFPAESLLALALGCDMIAVAREAMLSIGCIQAQQCHSGRCPTGVATHNKWLVHGLDPRLKAERFANYIQSLRKELLRLSRACGKEHASLVTWEQFDMLDGRFGSAGLDEVFGCEGDWGLPPQADQDAIRELMRTL
jgi:glutamate synthase (ferredoxin)